MKRAVFLAILAAASHTVATAHAASGVSTLGLRIGADHLSNNSPDWQESALYFSQALGKRHSADVALVRTERFGMRDTQLQAAYALPISQRLTGAIDINASASHRVLPKYAVGLGLQYEFVPAWLVHAGVRGTRYDSASVTQGTLMLERYVADFSVAAAWRPSRVQGTTAHVGELRANYYYGERDSFGLILAAGREAESVGGSVRLTSLHSAALVGRHWLNPDWAISYGISHSRQGGLYTRTGLQLGLQTRF